jgi:hypothetical protein
VVEHNQVDPFLLGGPHNTVARLLNESGLITEVRKADPVPAPPGGLQVTPVGLVSDALYQAALLECVKNPKSGSPAQARSMGEIRQPEDFAFLAKSGEKITSPDDRFHDVTVIRPFAGRGCFHSARRLLSRKELCQSGHRGGSIDVSVSRNTALHAFSESGQSRTMKQKIKKKYVPGRRPHMVRCCQL